MSGVTVYNLFILIGWMTLIGGLFMVAGISAKDELPKILAKAALAIGAEIFGAAVLIAGILYNMW